MAHATTTISPAAFSTFGELLRYLRRRQRMTQIELAIAVGYSTAQISRLEQNLRRPNPSTLQALFIPILNLEHDSQLAARLLELAHAAHDKQYPDSSLSEPEPTGEPGSAGQEPETQPPQLNMFDAVASAHILLTKLYLPRPRLE